MWKSYQFVPEAESSVPDETEMQKINALARRELSAQEVYTFPVILCDNEIDRDGERFTVPALEKLAQLFVGRTGIFDHNPKGENQTARVYAAQVQCDPKKTTQAGEAYHCLRAQCYMVRTKANADLILEIDAGIKKEVSVGCAVARVSCSVCGADLRDPPCGHVVGQSYGGKLCHHVLEDPVDAYEWSFVAVPAQVAAGVTKQFSGLEDRPFPLVKALEEAQDTVALSPSQARQLGAYMLSLQEKARQGEEAGAQLRGEILRLAAMARPAVGDIPGEVLERAVERMDFADLKAYREALVSRMDSCTPLAPQFAPVCALEESHTDDGYRVYLPLLRLTAGQVERRLRRDDLTADEEERLAYLCAAKAYQKYLLAQGVQGGAGSLVVGNVEMEAYFTRLVRGVRSGEKLPYAFTFLQACGG